MTVRAYVLIQTEVGKAQSVVSEIASIDGVTVAHDVTGPYDVIVQAQVLDIIDEQIRTKGMGLMLISHDLNLVSRYCDRIMVMSGGRIVETCAARDLMAARHPYTQGLLAAMPRLDERREELPVLDRAGWSGT